LLIILQPDINNDNKNIKTRIEITITAGVNPRYFLLFLNILCILASINYN